MAFGFFNKKIEDILPGKVSTGKEELFCYGFDASSSEGAPSAVVRPSGTAEVSEAAAYAFKNNIPIIPRGAGTGMTGGSVPLNDTVILSLEGMNRIIDIDEKNMVAIVEPGVINSHLQEKLEETGLFYPPDPASMKFCTLGGNVAENAGGPRAIKYGVTKDYVLGLETVLPDGRVLMTGGKTYKGVVGYDLTRLLVGSEGTLGIITKIFLKVLPLPEETVTLLCTFSKLGGAAQTVGKITSSGIIPRTLEFMDSESIRAVENYKPFGLPRNAEALLLIEVDGAHAAVSEEAEKVASICASLNGEISIADDIYSKQRLWEARRAISPALYHIKPTKINEDIVVPRGRIPEMLQALREIAEKYDLIIANFGHAGDGNIHVNVMTDKEDEEEYQRATDSVKDIFEAALKLDGTISGEHGVGITKKQYVGMELSDVSIDIMKAVKNVFDPKGIMNPGKMFPSD
ncbi:MAG TPA: FAD-binding protein [Nitrospirae bacterium]|nr:putative FAD-linked oxidoreductase [bacterium BMS3Abin06]HDH11491.1 FAD-binding protein [Nitrospirota bacterium]HDZ01355.1 FAD-binding protein [Nitrospirota bacterium]